MNGNKNVTYNTNHLGGTTLLTIAFVVLKLCGVINWSWWLVLLPTLIYVGFVILAIIIGVVLLYKFRDRL